MKINFIEKDSIYQIEQNKKALKQAIKQVANEENLTEIEVITLMQAGATKNNDEIALTTLSKIKREYRKDKEKAV